MEFIIQALSIPSLLILASAIIGLIFIYKKKISLTLGLVILNFIIFVITLLFYNTVILELGFRPMYLSLEQLPQIYTLFTSMFLHSGFWHLFGNMIALFFIGSALEQRVGPKNFLIVYLIGGIGGAIIHSLISLGTSDASIPLVGASGAIFALMGALGYSYTNDTVVMPIPLGIIAIVRPIRVLYAVIAFSIFETVFAWMDPLSNTAHLAHIGGLISGALIAIVLIGKQGSRIPSTFSTRSTNYYNPYNQPQKRKINFKALRKFATTPELNAQLNRIEEETVPQVRDIWLEDYLEKIRCPQCGSSLIKIGRQMQCPEGHIQFEF